MLKRCSLNEVDVACKSLAAQASSCSDEEMISVASAIHNRIVWSDRRMNRTLAKLMRQLSGDIRVVDAFLALIEVRALEAASHRTSLRCMSLDAS